ncbi:energy transducer TonB family protein [Magnetospirillum fulvum]|uniref:Protein TonB n=1 Tax=Magnetospirillum fulvum TaxID=1082 RepID=A0A1H6HG25_MAGFU|nr:energy transducer TonB [Magnetospirillum fulvum]SEH32893.1 protein TonB [Magnetospirillum fulvum]
MTGAARAESWNETGARLWGVSGGLVLLLHASLIASAISWKTAHPPAPPPPEPMMIELAPPPMPEAPPKPVVTPPPPPKPVERKVVEPVKRPPPLVRKAEIALPKPVEAPPTPPTAAAPPEPPQPAIAPATQPAPAQPSAAAIDARRAWQGALRAHLERHKRYPRSAQARRQEGIVTVRFTMNRSGEIVSSRLERSSGAAILDDEGLALLERAQPLPVPPPDVKGDTIELVVPIEFFLK